MVSGNKAQNMEKTHTVKFVDLFAGMGGIRIGFEHAFEEAGFATKCILTSEIKQPALEALKHNFGQEHLQNDIKDINEEEIEDFDFLLAGFPCQAFSAAGNRDGFSDTRGTLFFEVERILAKKQPFGFILENVEGLVKHDLRDKKDKIGNTLKTILHSLEKLGYKYDWDVLDSKDFGLAQSRKRVYIAGTLKEKIIFQKLKHEKNKKFKDIQEHGLATLDTDFTRKLLSHYKPAQLLGKAIKDKRGGKDNIHSWDFELKGKVSSRQKELLEALLKERRKKHWAEKIGIDWMDGMALTLEQIRTFFDDKDLENMLQDLVQKGYIKYEYPKTKITKITEHGHQISRRQQDETKEKGYNIVSGKLSFEFSKILDKNGIAPTLVASDVEKIGVIDGSGIRRLSLREGLRLFGYPETYSLEMFDKNATSKRKAFDLLGNTVAVPVIKAIAEQMACIYQQNEGK